METLVSCPTPQPPRKLKITMSNPNPTHSFTTSQQVFITHHHHHQHTKTKKKQKSLRKVRKPHHHHHYHPYMVKEEKITTIHDYDSSISNTCPVCGKPFLSQKALFGHMRCHPERQWRGIRSPPSSTTSTTTTLTQVDSSTPSDLTSFLTNWSLTAKRGRRSLVSRANAEPPAKLQLATQAAESGLHSSLPLLSGFQDLQLPDKSNKRRHADEDDFPSKKLQTNHERKMVSESTTTYDEGICSSSYEVGSAFDLIQANRHFIQQNMETEYAADYKDWGNFLSLGVIGTKKNNIEMIGKEGNGLIDSKFRCDICNKCFPCYQALGGHRSSHKKGQKLDISVLHPPLANDNAVSNSTDILNVSLTSSDNSAKYRCKICNKSFSKGQALGGHMRLHSVAQPFKGPNGVTSLSSVTSLEQVVSESGSGRAIGFGVSERSSESKENSSVTLQEQVSGESGSGRAMDFDMIEQSSESKRFLGFHFIEFL